MSEPSKFLISPSYRLHICCGGSSFLRARPELCMRYLLGGRGSLLFEEWWRWCWKQSAKRCWEFLRQNRAVGSLRGPYRGDPLIQEIPVSHLVGKVGCENIKRVVRCFMAYTNKKAEWNFLGKWGTWNKNLSVVFNKRNTNFYKCLKDPKWSNIHKF